MTIVAFCSGCCLRPPVLQQTTCGRCYCRVYYFGPRPLVSVDWTSSLAWWAVTSFVLQSDAELGGGCGHTSRRCSQIEACMWMLCMHIHPHPQPHLPGRTRLQPHTTSPLECTKLPHSQTVHAGGSQPPTSDQARVTMEETPQQHEASGCACMATNQGRTRKQQRYGTCLLLLQTSQTRCERAKAMQPAPCQATPPWLASDGFLGPLADHTFLDTNTVASTHLSRSSAPCLLRDQQPRKAYDALHAQGL
jgi:hypothetical protein